jgi:hypothetical protein
MTRRVSRKSKPEKKSVELRPSRIRRDPVPQDKPAGGADKVHWETGEREIKIAILGIILFALAINAVILGISAYWV